MAKPKKLVPPENLNIDFCPSPKQYDLWKLLQPECPLCGGEVSQKLIGYDAGGNEQFKPYCTKCNNTNIPQLVLGGGAAGKQTPLPAFTVMYRLNISLIAGNSDR